MSLAGGDAIDDEQPILGGQWVVVVWLMPGGSWAKEVERGGAWGQADLAGQLGDSTEK